MERGKGFPPCPALSCLLFLTAAPPTHTLVPHSSPLPWWLIKAVLLETFAHQSFTWHSALTLLCHEMSVVPKEFGCIWGTTPSNAQFTAGPELRSHFWQSGGPYRMPGIEPRWQCAREKSALPCCAIALAHGWFFNLIAKEVNQFGLFW